MKKNIKIFSSFFTIIIFGMNGTVACTTPSSSPPNPTGREWAVSMLNLKNYNEITSDKSYYVFVKKYESEIQKPASSDSKKEFDDLYDSGVHGKIWNTFSDLNTDLTTTKLSSAVTTNVNWPDLYQQAKVPTAYMYSAELDLSRFYNIFARLYTKDNVVKLVQRAEFQSLRPNVFGVTSYRTDATHPEQIMGYGGIFADMPEIIANYNAGYAASKALISTTVHEYGHALSNFMGCNDTQKANFNMDYWPPQNNIKSTPIKDRTKLLMDYLDTKANIFSNDTEKLLFPLIVVRSNYGRARWLEHKDNLNDEFFAEAFDEWLDTPANQRNWNWELLNGFFINMLPSYL